MDASKNWTNLGAVCWRINLYVVLLLYMIKSVNSTRGKYATISFWYYRRINRWKIIDNLENKSEYCLQENLGVSAESNFNCWNYQLKTITTVRISPSVSTTLCKLSYLFLFTRPCSLGGKHFLWVKNVFSWFHLQWTRIPSAVNSHIMFLLKNNVNEATPLGNSLTNLKLLLVSGLTVSKINIKYDDKMVSLSGFPLGLLQIEISNGHGKSWNF